MDNGASAEMPKYECHKTVWALKIKAVEPDKSPLFNNPVCRGDVSLGTACDRCERCKWYAEGNELGATITPEDTRYAPFKVDRKFLKKHDPQVGGYYVVYKDGYKSYSPAKAFEDGYSLIA